MEKFNNTLQSTMEQYSEALTRLAGGEEQEKPRKKLYVSDLECLFDLEGCGLSGLTEIGVEILDRNTGERLCYGVNSAWYNEEWDEVTLTIEVDRLPKIEE